MEEAQEGAQFAVRYTDLINFRFKNLRTREYLANEIRSTLITNEPKNIRLSEEDVQAIIDHLQLVENLCTLILETSITSTFVDRVVMPDQIKDENGPGPSTPSIIAPS